MQFHVQSHKLPSVINSERISRLKTAEQIQTFYLFYMERIHYFTWNLID